MKFVVEIACDNAAFESPHEGAEYANSMELTRILTKISRELAEQGAAVGMSSPIMDVNGNTVGAWKMLP